LGSDAAEGFVFFDVNGAMGFSDGLEDGFFIEGTDGSDIHHFRADAVFGFKDFSGFQAGDDRATVGDEGDVAALAFDVGDTEGDKEFAIEEFDGLESAAEAFCGLFRGENFGRRLVRVSEDPA
jgi:hypothetical protein